MNVAIKFISAEAIMQCYKITPVKGFMDDLFLKLKNVHEIQILLDRTSCILKWARMSLKSDSHLPKKIYLLNLKPFKNDEKCFLFHFKSSFHSYVI